MADGAAADAGRGPRRLRGCPFGASRERQRPEVLLACGLYSNVLRILVPFAATDDELDRGLEIMEESLVDAIRGAG